MVSWLLSRSTPPHKHSPPSLPPAPPPRAPALFSSPGCSLTADMTAGGEWALEGTRWLATCRDASTLPAAPLHDYNLSQAGQGWTGYWVSASEYLQWPLVGCQLSPGPGGIVALPLQDRTATHVYPHHAKWSLQCRYSHRPHATPHWLTICLMGPGGWRTPHSPHSSLSSVQPSLEDSTHRNFLLLCRPRAAPGSFSGDERCEMWGEICEVRDVIFSSELDQLHLSPPDLSTSTSPLTSWRSSGGTDTQAGHQRKGRLTEKQEGWEGNHISKFTWLWRWNFHI